MLQSLEAPLQYSWNKRHDRFLEEFYNWMETRWSGELIHWGNATATGHDTMRLPFRKMLPATPYLDPNPDGEVFETPRCLFHGTSSTRLLAILTARRLIRGARCFTKNGISRYGVSCTESDATALLYAYPAPLPSSDKCKPRMKIQCVLELKAYRATKVTHEERPKTYIVKEPWLQLEALHIILWHADAPHRDMDFCSHPDAEEMKACQHACEWNDFFLDWNPKPVKPVYTKMPRETTSTRTWSIQSHGIAASEQYVAAAWRSAQTMSASSHGYDTNRLTSSSLAICDTSTGVPRADTARTEREVKLPDGWALMKNIAADNSDSHDIGARSSENQDQSRVHASIDNISSSVTDRYTPCREDNMPRSAMTDAALAIFELHVVATQSRVGDLFLTGMDWNYHTMEKHLGDDMSHVFRQGLPITGHVQRVQLTLQYILTYIPEQWLQSEEHLKTLQGSVNELWNCWKDAYNALEPELSAVTETCAMLQQVAEWMQLPLICEPRWDNGARCYHGITWSDAKRTPAFRYHSPTPQQVKNGWLRMKDATQRSIQPRCSWRKEGPMPPAPRWRDRSPRLPKPRVDASARIPSRSSMVLRSNPKAQEYTDERLACKLRILDST